MTETQVIDISTDGGLRWEFRPEGGDWGDIKVPYGGWRKQGHKVSAGTYRVRLPIPEAAAGRSIQLYFEAINFGCRILIGRDEKSLTPVLSHIAPWMPVIADITPFVEAGKEYLLVIEVKGRNKYQHEVIAMRYAWNDGFVPGKIKAWMVPQAAAWLEDMAEGIIRGARMNILPAIHLSEPYIVTSVSSGTINPYVKVNNITDRPVSGVLRCRLSSATGQQFDYPEMMEIPFTLNEHDTRRFDLIATVWGLGRDSYWWPNVPYKPGYRAVLHNLTIDVLVDGKLHHTLTQRFGFREFTWKGNRYYLNGVPCNLRGDNQQETNFGTDAYGTHPGFGKPTSTCAGWPGAVDNLQRANFNVMRIHQVPPTPYMLDVCDEMGLMIVDETPIRNSEGLEDWVGGWENMINTARGLALRDRNHPSVVIWSAANEIWSNRPLSLALQGAIWSVDWTRPVIIDGIGDVGPEVINMNHYVGGCGTYPETGGEKRLDRPYGETEDIWPNDNGPQGFAWMATSVRWRRLQGNADLRNYVLNNAWPTYVPGQSRDQQFLEKGIKEVRWPVVKTPDEIMPDIHDPWNHPNIILMQKCYNPCTACDVEFDRANRHSNEKGEWPVVKPKLARGRVVKRQIAIFNDTFEGELVQFRWSAMSGEKQLAGGDMQLQIPLGSFIKVPVAFRTPSAGEVQLRLQVLKCGELIFEEDAIAFEIGE